MSLVDDDTLDGIGRVVEFLTFLKSRAPLEDMVLDNVIAPMETTTNWII